MYVRDSFNSASGYLIYVVGCLLNLALVAPVFAELHPQTKSQEAIVNLETLGEMLFSDVNLSFNRTQSCATCHNPATAFADKRSNKTNGASSLGADSVSLGDRSAPTAAYAALTPVFHQNSNGEYEGGHFWDGRAQDLEAQAGGPPLNPIEMGMPDKKTVVERLMENSLYVDSFKFHFGGEVFKDESIAYGKMTEAIAAFERTDAFASFDSKYDRYLDGEYELSEQEELGMTLFFSQQFSNCQQCHQLKKRPMAKHETFTNYRYHNIGVPANVQARKHNGVQPDHVDNGLFANPAVNDPRQKGKFKVPTLRNVAVTAPYMHNGVFGDLKTVVLFYNKYNSKNKKRQINPETGHPWRDPEVSENLALKELQEGDALDDKRVEALVAFLELLTDKRYEPLLGK